MGQKECNITNLTSLFEALEDPNQTESCLGKDAMIFAQTRCYQDEDTLLVKKRIALAIVCMGIFMCLVYHSFMYYRLQFNNIDFKIWDGDTVTLNDYSVELEFTKR